MPATKEIDNSQNMIDSRDVIERIDYLEGIDEPDDDETKELAALKALAEEAEGYAADWKYGEALIRDSYFQDYAQQLADDIGAIPKDVAWPMTCIDWEEAAKQLQQDYTSVDFDGVDYWIR